MGIGFPTPVGRRHHEAPRCNLDIFYAATPKVINGIGHMLRYYKGALFFSPLQGSSFERGCTSSTKIMLFVCKLGVKLDEQTRAWTTKYV